MAQSSPFLKHLASSSRATRAAALDSLRTYLSTRSTFTDLDFLKLWKALFYCLYMQDKPLHQQRLAQDLADLTGVLQGEENVIGWLRAFWGTMGREWAGIDGLRMDKFLYLVRCYVRKGWEVCTKRKWEEGFLKRYLAVLQEVPLKAREHKIPDGLRYHVLDIYVDELEKADSKHEAPVEDALEPVRAMGAETLNKKVRERARECLEDERLAEWRDEGKGTEVDGGAEAVDGVSKARTRDAGAHAGAIEDDGDDDDEFGGFDD